MICIAYNHTGKVVSVVNSRSKELAVAFWQGKGITPYSVKTLDDFTPLEEHPTGVYPIVQTRKSKVGMRGEEFIVVE